MPPIPAAVEAITLFVADPERSRAFYGPLLDREPVHVDADSVAFRLDGLILNLLRLTAADELVGPARPATAEAAVQHALTIGVEDVDATCSALVALGVGLLNGPLDRPWGLRTASFADPDGHVWEVAARLP